MSTTEQRFQSFLTSVRPHRIAIFANIADPNWYQNCLGIIEFLAKLWGGSHSVIIPTDGNTIDDEFWAILSAHDPDLFYLYQPTGYDFRARAPEEFNDEVAREVKEWAIQNDHQDDQVYELIEKEALKSTRELWGISEILQEELCIRLAPFHIEKDPYYEQSNRKLVISPISKGNKPHYPLTALSDVLRATTRPSRITQIIINDETETSVAPPKLWLAATIGCCDDDYYKELAELQITPVCTSVREEIVSEIIRTGVRPWRDPAHVFPLRLTSTALTPIRSGLAKRFQLPTVVVVGSSLKDFCLYFDLYRLQGRALWLPPWFMPVNGKYPGHLTTAVREAEEAGRLEHNEHFVLVSYSVAIDELHVLNEKIRNLMLRKSAEVQSITAEMIRKQIEHPSRVYSNGDIGNITTHMLLNHSLPGWFESPVPRTLNPARPTLHRWIVDITFMQHLVPRHPVLGRIIVNGPNVGDVRAGSGCVSYMCPGVLIVGDHMETSILRPLIHVPEAEEIFRVILDDCDYQATTSDKGRYETAAIQKFGDLEKTGYALWSEKHRSLLRKFLDISEPQDGVFDHGVLLKDLRRYLNYSSIKKIIGEDTSTRLIIDEYIEKGIFYRGFIFRCENCSDVAWHSIRDLDQRFTCRRCGLNQQYKSASWKHPNEPSWFYKLDEMIYLMLKHNGDVPLLTLAALQRQSSESFLFRPEICLMQKGSQKTFLEIDVCCISNGKLCIGEAKSTNSLKGDKLTPLQTAERYRDIALKIGASTVVFSTSAKTWDQTSQSAMQIAFEKYPHIDVQKWTSDMLYGSDKVD